MSKTVIDLRKWKWMRAMRKFIKGFVLGDLEECDRYGPISAPLPEQYDIAELSNDRIINGKRVGDIRAERLEQEQRQYDVKFYDPTT